LEEQLEALGNAVIVYAKRTYIYMRATTAH